VSGGGALVVGASGVVIVLVVEGTVSAALVVDGSVVSVVFPVDGSVVSVVFPVDGSVVSVVFPVDGPVLLVVFPVGASVVAVVVPVDESVVLVELGGLGSPVLLGASDVVLLVVDDVPESGGVVGDVKLDTIAAAELRICGIGAGRLTEIDSGGPEGTNMSVNSQTGLVRFGE
jgi:hypothetical protein